MPLPPSEGPETNNFCHKLRIDFSLRKAHTYKAKFELKRKPEENKNIHIKKDPPQELSGETSNFTLCVQAEQEKHHTTCFTSKHHVLEQEEDNEVKEQETCTCGSYAPV